EAGELSRHAERLGLGAAGGDEVAGAGGVAGAVPVEEHRGPSTAAAHDPWARTEAFVHRKRVGEVALRVVPAAEASSKPAQAGGGRRRMRLRFGRYVTVRRLMPTTATACTELASRVDRGARGAVANGSTG